MIQAANLLRLSVSLVYDFVKYHLTETTYHWHVFLPNVPFINIQLPSIHEQNPILRTGQSCHGTSCCSIQHITHIHVDHSMMDSDCIILQAIDTIFQREIANKLTDTQCWEKMYWEESNYRNSDENYGNLTTTLLPLKTSLVVSEGQSCSMLYKSPCSWSIMSTLRGISKCLSKFRTINHATFNNMSHSHMIQWSSKMQSVV